MTTIIYLCHPQKCTFKLVAVLVQADLISVGNCRPPYQQNKGKLTHKHFPTSQFSPKHHTGCQFVKLTIDWVYLVSYYYSLYQIHICEFSIHMFKHSQYP